VNLSNITGEDVGAGNQAPREVLAETFAEITLGAATAGYVARESRGVRGHKWRTHLWPRGKSGHRGAKSDDARAFLTCNPQDSEKDAAGATELYGGAPQQTSPGPSVA